MARLSSSIIFLSWIFLPLYRLCLIFLSLDDDYRIVFIAQEKKRKNNGASQLDVKGREMRKLCFAGSMDRTGFFYSHVWFFEHQLTPPTCEWMKDGPSEQKKKKNVNVWVRKGQTLWCRSHGSSTAHHLPQPFICEWTWNYTEIVGKETTVLCLHSVSPNTRFFFGTDANSSVVAHHSGTIKRCTVFRIVLFLPYQSGQNYLTWTS